MDGRNDPAGILRRSGLDRGCRKYFLQSCPGCLGGSGGAGILQPLPVQVLQQKGYYITAFCGADGVTLQLLAADYDTDIDHKLDEIRYHRSRVNYVNKVVPIGISREIKLQTAVKPAVYTPFNDSETSVSLEGDVCTLQLPENCAYIILHFPLA